MSGPFQLAELACTIARAADPGTGYPAETSLRTCLFGVALGRAAKLSDDELRDIYYAALLRHVGCTSSAHEETVLAGNEHDLRNALSFLDLGSPRTAVPRLVRAVGRGRGALGRTRAIARFLARSPKDVPVAIRGRCEVAIRFCVRLGLGPAIERALGEAYERFDGKGLPDGKRGEDLSVAARILGIAEAAGAFLSAGGRSAVLAVLSARSGGQFDPGLVATFLEHAAEMFAAVEAPSLWQRAIDAEPLPRVRIGASKLVAVAEVMADFADLKSTWLLGHSRGVAQLARAAGERLGLSESERAELYLAGLVHDLGRVAISNAIWDKPGALDRGELDLVRTHAHHTARALELAGDPLAAVSRLASLAHERLDASGYHRGSGGGTLAIAARILAAADVAQALGEVRPHRAALAPEAIANTMRELVASGRLDARATDAVLAARGVVTTATRAVHPAGLSAREVEVLQLVARGLTDKEIANQLGISHRTVHHHNQHAFGKIGVTTRSAAALFLVEHGLLDPA